MIYKILFIVVATCWMQCAAQTQVVHQEKRETLTWKQVTKEDWPMLVGSQWEMKGNRSHPQLSFKAKMGCELSFVGGVWSGTAKFRKDGALYLTFHSGLEKGPPAAEVVKAAGEVKSFMDEDIAFFISNKGTLKLLSDKGILLFTLIKP